MTPFRLPDKRYEEIKETVINMFEFYSVSCIPISGFEIATKMNIKTIPYSAYNDRVQKLEKKFALDGFFTEDNDGQLCIYYNDEMSYGRINHTILHEIAHIILNHTEDSDLAEAEAKFFAKYALAPPILIHKLKLNDPFDISCAFDISYEAASYAYNYYNKWLRFGSDTLTEYELKTLHLFKEAI